jgi:rhodanese-related sulfurtransferase
MFKKPLQTILSLLFIITISGCNTEPEYKTISQQQLQANDKAGTPQLILDVRSAEEFAEGHVPNAINISHEQVGAKLQQLKTMSNDQKIPIIVYCRSGHRAGIALNTLHNNGFNNIVHLDGDMNAWNKAKLPIEK